jgi:hypothetical protein
MNSHLMQHTVMPPLEVVGPGGSLSMLLLPHLNGEMPAEKSLASGDGGIQLQLDNGGAPSSAGRRRCGSGGFCTALDSKFCYSYSYVFLFKFP